jgi:hypothetical protein
VRSNRPRRHERLPRSAAHPAAGAGCRMAPVDRWRTYGAKRRTAAAGDDRRRDCARAGRPGRCGRPRVRPVCEQRELDPRRHSQCDRGLPQPSPRPRVLLGRQRSRLLADPPRRGNGRAAAFPGQGVDGRGSERTGRRGRVGLVHRFRPRRHRRSHPIEHQGRALRLRADDVHDSHPRVGK